MPRYYPSKVGTFYYATILFIVFVLLGNGIVAARASGLGVALAVFVPVAVLALGLPLWLLRSTGYTLESTHLLVKSGPFSWEIKLSDIRSITPTRNPLSSPALSLDRLRIEYGKHGAIMISPADKDGFLKELEILRAGLG